MTTLPETLSVRLTKHCIFSGTLNSMKSKVPRVITSSTLGEKKSKFIRYDDMI